MRHAGQIVLDKDGLPRFPALPRLYRFDAGANGVDISTRYIGESTSLARRASNDRNAKTDRSTQRTSRRIHKEIVKHLVSGGTIDFAVATEVRSDNGTIDLRRAADRRFAENAVFSSLNGSAALDGAVDPDRDRASGSREGSNDHG